MSTYGGLCTVNAKEVNECDVLFEEIPRATVFELKELSMESHGHFATIDEFCGCPFACRDRQLLSSLRKGLSARSLHFSGSSDLSLFAFPR